MNERTQAQIELIFDGDDVRDGSMNVRDLAPSMLAVGTLFESANVVLNGTNASINVNVKGKC